MYRKKLTNLLEGVGSAVTNGNGHASTSSATKGKKEGAAAANGLDQFSADDETAEEDEEEEEVEEEEEESDEQPEPVVTATKKPPSPRKSSRTSASSSSPSSLRQRFTDAVSGAKEERERFTPTPRRSIHSYKVTETTKQTLTKSNDGRQLASDYSYQKETFKVGSCALCSLKTKEM